MGMAWHVYINAARNGMGTAWVRHGLLVVDQLVHRVVFAVILLWNQLFVMVVRLNVELEILFC
jgi:hypothetical protein